MFSDAAGVVTIAESGLGVVGVRGDESLGLALVLDSLVGRLLVFGKVELGLEGSASLVGVCDLQDGVSLDPGLVVGGVDELVLIGLGLVLLQ